MLDITKKAEDSRLDIALAGRLDTATAPSLEAVISDPEFSKVEELVFDFDKLEYVSSAGLRVLLAAHKKMIKQGSMKLTNVSEDVMEIFDITGFTDILTIEK